VDLTADSRKFQRETIKADPLAYINQVKKYINDV
jgi:hypothetical protein